MAFNPSDTQFSLIAEATPGTTPATPVFLRMDYIQGDEPNLQSDTIESATVRQNRSGGGTRLTNFRVEGSLKGHLKRDAVTDLLIESVVGGAFTTNVAKGGSTDKSFTVEKTLVDGATRLYRRFNGCQVTKFGLTCEASGNAEYTAEILGLNATTASAIITGATYTAASNATQLTGLDVGTITVAGLTVLGFRKLDFSIEQSRETMDRMGNSVPLGISANGNRKVKLTLEFYRTDWNPELVCIPDNPIAVSFSIGTLTNGYTFTLPAAKATIPQDSVDGAKAMVTVEFSGDWDPTANTNVSVSKP